MARDMLVAPNHRPAHKRARGRKVPCAFRRHWVVSLPDSGTEVVHLNRSGRLTDFDMNTASAEPGSCRHGDEKHSYPLNRGIRSWRQRILILQCRASVPVHSLQLPCTYRLSDEHHDATVRSCVAGRLGRLSSNDPHTMYVHTLRISRRAGIIILGCGNRNRTTSENRPPDGVL